MKKKTNLMIRLLLVLKKVLFSCHTRYYRIYENILRYSNIYLRYSKKKENKYSCAYKC